MYAGSTPSTSHETGLIHRRRLRPFGQAPHNVVVVTIQTVLWTQMGHLTALAPLISATDSIATTGLSREVVPDYSNANRALDNQTPVEEVFN